MERKSGIMSVLGIKNRHVILLVIRQVVYFT
jgi:hypothetical protein